MLAAGLMLAAAAASAGDKDRRRRDHDTALRLLNSGEIVRLEVVLMAVKEEVPGEIVGMDLELKQGLWVYEFKMISPQGVFLEVVADARTAKVITVKTKAK